MMSRNDFPPLFFMPLGAACGGLTASAVGASPLFTALIAAGAALAAGVAIRGGESAGEERAAAEAASPVAADLDTQALSHLPSPVILIDAEQRIRRINAAALSLTGGEGSEIGAPLVSAIRAPDLIGAVEDALARREPGRVAFSLIRSREERALLAHIQPLTPTEPRAPAALILIEDQTRMRQVEQMRRDFLANASHELKTPLASLIGFIETLQGPAKDDEAARTRFLGIMAAQAERMKRLVEDLMSLTRIEMNQHRRPTEPVDLGALAWAMAAALEPVAAEAGATIQVECEPEGPVAIGDRDQLAQLLTNLIDNALKYGGPGVTVTIGPAAPAPEWPGMVGLVVSDDGPGIAREHLPRLTERFYRVSAARSRAVGGTGLGLAIAKHILQRHRGEMRIRSKPGEGAAFTVWLPRRNDVENPDSPTGNDENVESANKDSTLSL